MVKNKKAVSSVKKKGTKKSGNGLFMHDQNKNTLRSSAPTYDHKSVKVGGSIKRYGSGYITQQVSPKDNIYGSGYITQQVSPKDRIYGKGYTDDDDDDDYIDESDPSDFEYESYDPKKLPILSDYDFDKLFNKDKGYLGTFSKDQLLNISPKRRIKNCFVIINLMNRNEGNGSHWVGLYIKDRIAYYFDSFGMSMPEEVSEFLNLKFKRVDKIYSNTLQIQNTNSTSCGWYVFFVMINMIRKRTFFDILNIFNNTELDNEYILFELVRNATKLLE